MINFILLVIYIWVCGRVGGCIYRGYYMAARGYEFYLRVLQHEKIKFVSPSGHVMFCLLYIYIDEMSRFKTTYFIHFRNDEKLFTNH